MLHPERRQTVYGVILSLLRDGGELSLMNGDNNFVGLICHNCGFYSSVT